MTQVIQSAIVRIKTADKVIVGAGFLIADRHILTCAHVVSDSLEQPRQAAPKGLIHLDFPFIAPKQTLTAQVIFWQPKQSDGIGDIAGLELTSSPLDGVQPAHLVAMSDIWGHSFRAFGFPLQHDDGVWASGVLRDRKANGHIQIEDTKATGYAVQAGFSGAPVWGEEVQAVVGMIVTAERRDEIKAAFMIPAASLLESWPFLRTSRMSRHPRSATTKFIGQVPTVEAPLLIGLLIDVSGSMVKALRANASVSKDDLSETVDLLIRKIVESCQTSDSEEVLPKIALFVYGFGFGQLRKGINEFLQKIGLIAPSEPMGAISSDSVRDLFAEIAQEHRLPATPDAATLQKYGEWYKGSIRDQLVDTELGPSVLYDGLRQIYRRLCQEKETPYYPQPLLIVISDGQVSGATDSDVAQICQQITALDAILAFCYVGKRDVTAPKTLYSQALSEWPAEARLLFEVSSQLTEENALLKGVMDEAKKRGWRVPGQAKLFVQVNHSEDIAEFVEIMLRHLQG